ncbi:S8 family serine peptidase [Priestia filamentosa]|uniref:S8 family serine peptidase n=1 Tax=Priestia filamentosa TaxID=1402861 RepID=UPI000E737AF1|nr:S8 family serine peptidase [Priestia filamentosa]MDT3766264.1 S8 family serine peptidase [Priestia filamentosa]RJS63077.1 hypothetical protein CJ485_23005 [Priestia filamentosa]
MIMKITIKRVLSIILFLLCTFCFNTIVNATATDVKNTYVIAMKEEKVPPSIDKNLDTNFPNVNYELMDSIGVIKIKANNATDTKNVLSYLKNEYQSEIESISQEKKIETPNQTNIREEIQEQDLSLSKSSNSVVSKSFFNQWQWNINVVTHDKKSYDLQKGNHDVKVAIIDSGIDKNHPDLKENIVSNGTSFVPNDKDIIDRTGHGTMVAGIIAGNGNLKGIAPNIGIVPYKVLKEDGGESIWVVKAIMKAADDGNEVINLSLGSFLSSKDKEEKALIKSYKRAINYAHKKGSIVVSSAGNLGIDLTNPKQISEDLGIPNDKKLYVPGGLDSVISVGAVNKDKLFASYSNYGRMLDLTAPGGDLGPLYDSEGIVDVRNLILTTYPTYLPNPIASSGNLPSGYEFSYGTSLAAPSVSAVAAIILAEYREEHARGLSVKKVENIMYKTALSSDFNKYNRYMGKGSVDAYRALELINEY